MAISKLILELGLFSPFITGGSSPPANILYPFGANEL
nr:MAG TPA: hypothetical protein [Caudoviricetes sp.]